ncbi:MAG: signal transduction histidine kinase, LytS [Bryobacterales bacterium]|jgi:two-component system, LytTR family, sensor kinase|nr:signal transduction histidine kinase, LytS [Bryobacterales bacterium]
MLTQPQIAALLIKVAVATSIASILMRFARIQAILLQDERTVADRLQLAFIFSLLFGAGAEIRILSHNTYPALDLALEGSVMAGMLGGYVSALITGICVAIPDMFDSNYMSMPLYAAAGLVGALMHDMAPEKDDIWYFSPFVDLNLYRLLRQILRLNRNAIQRRVVERAAFNVTCNALVIVTELLRWGLYWLGFTQHGTFFLFAGKEPLTPAVLGASAVTTLFAVSLPIRVWSSFRAERQLEMQRALLVEARLAALTNQINPHFLFNTLNSVATLIRIDPDRARSMVYKLSSILRRLLKKSENLSPLREEISFIDDYLAIEMIRFGSKLRFSKDIEEAALDRLVPSMILQPIIENSIKHGLASKVEGGSIRLKAWVEDTQLHISIEDDGVGIPESKLGTVLERGVGVSNVNERLKVLFGSTYRLWIDSKEGNGTETLIIIPELENAYTPGADGAGRRGAVGAPSA